MNTSEGTTDGSAAHVTLPGEEDVPAPFATEFAEVRMRLDELAEAVGAVRANTDRIDEYRRLRSNDQEMIESLHRDNTELQQDQLTRVMMPLFRGLISLYDLMTDSLNEHETIQKLQRQVVQTLDQHGVTVYAPGLGEPFDSKRQDGTPVPTSRGEMDATVAAVRRVGFLRSATVIRPAAVEVYRLRRPADASTVH